MHDYRAPAGRGTARIHNSSRLRHCVAGVFAISAAIWAAPSYIYDIAPDALASEEGPRELVRLEGSAAKPDFSLPDLDGAQSRLSGHAGRVVLVHFFATWCEPCREELASLRALVERVPAERLTVL